MVYYFMPMFQCPFLANYNQMEISQSYCAGNTGHDSVRPVRRVHMQHYGLQCFGLALGKNWQATNKICPRQHGVYPELAEGPIKILTLLIIRTTNKKNT